MDKEHYFSTVYELCSQESTPGYRFFNKEKSVKFNQDPIKNTWDVVRQKPNTAAKIMTYRTDFNLSLTVHDVHFSSTCIPGVQRESFTRLMSEGRSRQVESHDNRAESFFMWQHSSADRKTCWYSVRWLTAVGTDIQYNTNVSEHSWLTEWKSLFTAKMYSNYV